jgi:predicted metal-dependent enzyme (double-stranded beta helix superfamily)
VIDRLSQLVRRFESLLAHARDEAQILESGRQIVSDVVRYDDWLPGRFSEPSAAGYRQYLLHCDSRERFSVVSFVWGPGQQTPIHNHTVWGLIGVLRGAEISERYSLNSCGELCMEKKQRLLPGSVDAVGPLAGDIHRVSNGYDDRCSISIHVYGANIGTVQRMSFDELGRGTPFISGYSNA